MLSHEPSSTANASPKYDELGQHRARPSPTRRQEKQLEVAHGFLGIHSGACNFEFEPMQNPCFTIHYEHSDEKYDLVDDGELPR